MHNHLHDAAKPRENNMQKKEEVRSEGKLGSAESSTNTSLREDWRVLMVRHPQTGFYYAAGLKLGQ
jgi:hypothetical protein